MGTIWKPDTCDCVIEIDDDGKWVATHGRCKLHDADGDAHLAEVLAHHRPFNDLSKYPSELRDTKEESDDSLRRGYTPAELDRLEKCRLAKHAECERIRKLKKTRKR